MSTWYFWFVIVFVPVLALAGDFLYQGIQRWFFPYDYQIIEEETFTTTSTGYQEFEQQEEMLSMLERDGSTSDDDRVLLPMAQLPRERTESGRHTGFAFDSPGYESYFSLQHGVSTPAKSWDVARRASMAPRRNISFISPSGPTDQEREQVQHGIGRFLVNEPFETEPLWRLRNQTSDS